MWPYAAAGLCALAAIILLVRLHSVRRSLEGITRQLAEKSAQDTNALITVTTGDSAVKRLAAELNVSLRGVRDERRRLQSGDAEIKTAITNASHDLRTPLTAICGYLDLLEGEAVSPQARRYLGIIRERTDAMRSLTEELFRYSVASSTTGALSPEPLVLNDVLEQSLAGFYRELTERGITPEITLPDEPVVRVLDDTALRRIIGNIVSNAVKYSDGDLAVTLSPDGVLTFSNHASNVTSVDVERLFDRFYTVENAKGSTGLGLSIAKLLCEKMGGSLTATCANGVLTLRLSFAPEVK